ncbi:hypothetical protein Hypma_005091 [Hypsizygus marmoreus]|uniref:Uncharacterized protein n=1 Tax=Hypsizygus marmoreus TaxID=39966 RepID=A0A369JXP0_HYPMA|nr:hypothetical protein Hypma_005091 [Hypsizygus marmoreus]
MLHARGHRVGGLCGPKLTPGPIVQLRVPFASCQIGYYFRDMVEVLRKIRVGSKRKEEGRRANVLDT